MKSCVVIGSPSGSMYPLWTDLLTMIETGRESKRGGGARTSLTSSANLQRRTLLLTSITPTPWSEVRKTMPSLSSARLTSSRVLS